MPGTRKQWKFHFWRLAAHRVISARIVAMLVLCFLARPIWAQPPSQPNFVFIFTDDQTYEALGSLGIIDVETPHLDQLARQGTRFTHTYNMGSWSGAVCVASRTMLNTGRFLWHADQVKSQLETERQAGRVWSEILRRAGYRTYLTGKWHVALDAEKAFDVVRHVRPGMPQAVPEMYDRPHPDRPDPWSPSDPKFGGFWEGGRHWSEVVADDAVHFLEEAAGDEQPFFMYLAFNAPHDPRQSPQEFVARYPKDRVQVPANFLTEYPFQDRIGCGPGLRDERLAPFPRTELAVQVHRGEYYASVSHADQQIGRILAALAATGKAAETYVFFTADHGLAVGHHGLFGKQNMYEHSVRVPLIVRGPGVAADRQVNAPVYLQDVMPTTLALAGVEVPAHVDFRSLLPALRGEVHQPYDAVYGAYLRQQRMVVHDGYKLIVYPEVPVVRLYHLASDPDELVDLASEDQYQPVIHRLAARLLQLQEETGDKLDLAANFMSPPFGRGE